MTVASDSCVKDFVTNRFILIQVKSKLRGHSKRITGLAFSSVLNVLVSSGADAQVIHCSLTINN